MQEHFNENYLETEKSPKTTFKGTFKPKELSAGAQEVTAEGEYYIHGVTKKVTVPGTITKTPEGLSIQAKYPVKLEDYKIKIPKAVFYIIAEEVEVSVFFNYLPI